MLMAGVLSGIRIVDFCRFVSGPFCTALLGDMGADVIRIDKIGGSEDRFTGPVTPEGTGAAFLQLNRNKRSLTLDPTHPVGREVVRRLVAHADVVAANMPTESLGAMGIDYATLRQIKPDIILMNITGFGSTGPYADRVGFDGVAQAMSGSTYLAGPPGQPVKANAPYADYGTAFLAAMGTVGAILHRERTGEGQVVECSLLSTAMTLSNPAIIEQVTRGLNRPGVFNRSFNSAPSDIFKTKDGSVILQIVGEPMFRRWCRLLEVTEWIGDARFATDAARVLNFEVLHAKMSEWSASRSTQDVVSAMQLARIPCGPVLTPQQAFDEPHLQAVGFWKYVDYPGFDQAIPLASPPVDMSASPLAIRTRSPTPGEHSDQILAELGYAAREIDELRARSII